MNRLITKKPGDNTPLTFPAMGAKPGAKTPAAPVTVVKKKKVVAKKPAPKAAAAKPNPFAAKAATALVSNFSAAPAGKGKTAAVTVVKGK